MSAAKLPPRKPDSERSHYVFLASCGCPFGLVERGRWCADEDAAWDSMYDTRGEERGAQARGVRCVYVSHEEYVATYYNRMAKRCPHA